MSADLAELDVVFLVWREAPRMLERHHAAVAAALPPDWSGTALLVENGAPASTSEAARALVARSYPNARRRVLRLPRNMGYARAMDLALAECAGRHVALVNSDGRPEPHMFARLVAALGAHPRALWAAPAVHGPGEDDEPPGQPYAEERLAGMTLVIDRERFLALGAFDPVFFFYNEDFDASLRVRRAGFELLRVPDARFHHGKGGRSRRGLLVREFWFAATDQVFVSLHDPSRVNALRRIARARPRALADHARRGSWPAVAALALATLTWPAAVVLAERRRWRPWDAQALGRWLGRHAPRATREALGAPVRAKLPG